MSFLRGLCKKGSVSGQSQGATEESVLEILLRNPSQETVSRTAIKESLYCKAPSCRVQYSSRGGSQQTG